MARLPWLPIIYVRAHYIIRLEIHKNTSYFFGYTDPARNSRKYYEVSLCVIVCPFVLFFWPLYFLSFCPFSFDHCIFCPFCDLRYLIILLLSSDFTNNTIMLFLSMLSIWLFSVLYRVLSTQTVCTKEHDVCMNLVNVVETSARCVYESC